MRHFAFEGSWVKQGSSLRSGFDTFDTCLILNHEGWEYCERVWIKRERETLRERERERGIEERRRSE